MPKNYFCVPEDTKPDIGLDILVYGVIGSTKVSGTFSLGSSPGRPAEVNDELKTIV